MVMQIYALGVFGMCVGVCGFVLGVMCVFTRRFLLWQLLWQLLL